MIYIYEYSLITMAHFHVPVNITLAERCNGYWKLYSITRKGNLSWNIIMCDDDIEDDKYTIIVSSSVIQQLFSPNIKIYQIRGSVIAFHPNANPLCIRKSRAVLV